MHLLVQTLLDIAHGEKENPNYFNMFLKHILDLTFYGYFNTYMSGITSFYFHQNHGCIGFIILNTISSDSDLKFLYRLLPNT